MLIEHKEAPAERVSERVSIAAAPLQVRAMELLARKHQRSLSGEIRMAMDAWLERCAKEDGAQPTEGR